MPLLKRFVIERDIPGVQMMTQAELCGAAQTSNAAIEQLAGSVQ